MRLQWLGGGRQIDNQVGFLLLDRVGVHQARSRWRSGGLSLIIRCRAAIQQGEQAGKNGSIRLFDKRSYQGDYKGGSSINDPYNDVKTEE
ncbi:hypothetical protein GCM10027321_39520 [Massilia terrae]